MFTVSAGISLTFTTLFYLFTPFFSDYFLVDYGNTRYILSFAIFFSLLSMVPVAILRRDLLFVLLGKTEVAAEIISLFLILLLWKLGFRLEAIASRLLTIGVFKFFVVFYFTRGTSVGM
ncbi:oligosaccharide flippase family protein, partial [Vibrio campbellii]|uniref:oligosaccharide flippase family protein n=1 Tax=Vibrio campbellii TaxID=680 RepID=UPI001E3644A4